MDMIVLIEPQNGRFKATTSQPVAMETEGASREEALQRLQELAKSRLAAGELVQVPLPNGDSSHPWMKFAGVWKDHPEFDQFQQNVAEYRRSLDVPESEP
ncbi:MAG: type II toxin-antitoxin system HicB family antitoxin [Candidatus Saccharimonas sp.]|nr:type II toxin-antitoxin system HicB family antitoxin [Planctomycetaceae bacterium]